MQKIEPMFNVNPKFTNQACSMPTICRIAVSTATESVSFHTDDYPYKYKDLFANFAVSMF